MRGPVRLVFSPISHIEKGKTDSTFSRATRLYRCYSSRSTDIWNTCYGLPSDPIKYHPIVSISHDSTIWIISWSRRGHGIRYFAHRTCALLSKEITTQYTSADDSMEMNKPIIFGNFFAESRAFVGKLSTINSTLLPRRYRSATHLVNPDDRDSSMI